MKKLIIAILIQFSILLTYSQTFEWLRIEELDYELNPGMITYSTATDTEENAYIFGTKEHVEFYNKSYGSLLLNKYDADGNQLWMRTINGKASGSGSACDASGNLYIIGSFRSTINFWGEDSISWSGTGINGFIAKVDPAGSILWALNLNDTYAVETDPIDMSFDIYGNVYVVH